MILIVDDDNAVRMSIALALKRAGYEPLTAASEAEALVAVRDERVRLAVLDLNLTQSTTGRQGVELLRKFGILRPGLPVIVITAWGTIPLAVEAMTRGASDFMTKPWSNADLLAKIKKALAKSEREMEEASRTETLDTIESDAIRQALRRCDGNVAEAAKQLGITRQSLYRRMEKFGI